ncbi:hypothetical protein W97_09341 [Coniosporium apollinis CBS 100218]|uniref:Enoyl-CoA hydratase domain-containing protein 3, mitochondrial n=1 Tax=Coniosporium apollinis (strain CBS 100218) TaxID=1168221 RepID=R7Z7C5_CONA1|nr:uncharacterized protein W97_09341 [Coniosporium apollinis CBS 100218]EON70075.1 hypothetical protein W97_09341 [Coniosporium apollinis CBS 100218]
MAFPPLPAGASYLRLQNSARRNALSLSILRSLRQQLVDFNTSPSGKLHILPPFKPEILSKLEAGDEEYAWLLDAEIWSKERQGLPKVLVLRSEGPVFCSGHDLGELRKLGHDETKETFALCAEVMGLIRRSPAPVIGVIQGLATAAGCQLALTTDFPIALASTPFRLPGASIGLPCTSPSTAVARRLHPGQAYRMLAMAEPVRADQLNGAVDVVSEPKLDAPLEVHSAALEARVAQVVEQLAGRTAGQPAALGKWAFWTHVGLQGAGTEGGGDGYEDAVKWTGRVMAVHARAGDAKEGVNAFFEKRKPEWKT